MRYLTSLGVLTIVGVLSISGASFATRSTNYEIFCAQVDTVSDSIAKLLVSQQIKSLVFRVGSNEMEIFARQRIEERLLGDGIRILIDSANAVKLSVSSPLVKVEYSSPVASHIFGSSDVERTVQSNYDVEISDTREIRIARSFTCVYRDTVRESEIPDLEYGSYGFLHGKADPGGFFDTMLQPVLFLASAAVVVYLFFTLRGS
jgi:hypothetical protein